jgi:hypothetical protein
LQERRNKRVKIVREEVKLFLFADGMILFLKDPRNSAKKLRDIINTFSNVLDTKSILKTQ